jgi:hypothetical protein
VGDEANKIDETVEGFTSIYGRADLNAMEEAWFDAARFESGNGQMSAADIPELLIVRSLIYWKSRTRFNGRMFACVHCKGHQLGKKPN